MGTVRKSQERKANTMNESLEFHEAASIFRLLVGEEFATFCESIKHGLRLPIMLYQGKILDGRNRYRACKETGTELRTENVEDRDDYDPETFDPIQCVVDLNDKRRTDTTSQRAMAAARAEALWEKQREAAKERQKAAGGDRTTEEGKALVAALPQAVKGKTRDKVAEPFGICGRTVAQAVIVKTLGVPELGAAVDGSIITVNKAEQIAKLPEAKQREAIAEAASAPGKRSPKKLRNRHKPTGKVPRKATISQLARLAMKEVAGGAIQKETVLHYRLNPRQYPFIKCVIERGTPRLIDAIDTGALTIHQAYKVAGAAEEEVNAAIDAAEAKAAGKRTKVARGKKIDKRQALFNAIDAVHTEFFAMDITGKVLPESPEDLERFLYRLTRLREIIDSKLIPLTKEVEKCLLKTVEQKTS